CVRTFDPLLRRSRVDSLTAEPRRNHSSPMRRRSPVRPPDARASSVSGEPPSLAIGATVDARRPRHRAPVPWPAVDPQTTPEGPQRSHMSGSLRISPLETHSSAATTARYKARDIYELSTK